MAFQTIPIAERENIAHALTGAIDRWQLGTDRHLQDAKTIYRAIGHTYKIIKTRVKDIKRARQITHPTPPQQKAQILANVIEELNLSSSSFKAAFGPRFWNDYLSMHKKNHYDVVFVGGGPIGLWTAILTKIHSATLSILILEKRATYLRNFPVTVEHDSFNEYPVGFHASMDQAVIDFKTQRNIRIKEIETRLLDLAKSLDIQIEFVSVSRPQDLHEIFPSTPVFIGSDGARSTVRLHLFQNEARLNHVIHRLVQINYQIKKMTPRNFSIKQNKKFAYTTIAAMKTTLIDERTSQTLQTTEKTLTFAVAENVFQNMGNATYATPFKVTSPDLPSDLLNDFYLWCGMKEETDGEVRIIDSEKIVGIDGLARISEAFVKVDQGHVWCLIGDSAASFPLQRGFNVGLKGGIRLAKALIDFLNDRSVRHVNTEGAEGEIPEPFIHYTSFGIQIENEELCFLQCPLTEKKLGIDVWKGVTKLGKFIPGATIDVVTATRYRNIGKDPGNTPMGRISGVKDRIAQAHSNYTTPSTSTPYGLSTMNLIQEQLRRYENGN